jgi:CubicO group peptidase (beta-lactamase class C family)
MGLGILLDPPGTYPLQEPFSNPKLAQGPPAPEAFAPPDEWIEILGRLPLMHQPGQRWMYSTGSDVLGVLVARAAGRTLETFLRERLFEPLGMHDTGFSVPADKLDRLPTSYAMNFETGELYVYDEPRDGQWSRPPAFQSGAGGLVSTIDDYLAFGLMMLNRGRAGKERILARPTVELMTTNQLTPEQIQTAGPILDAPFGWGFGVAVGVTQTNIASTPGRFGWDGGLGTSWYSDPIEGLVGILMTQSMAIFAMPALADFWTMVYQSIDD